MPRTTHRDPAAHVEGHRSHRVGWLRAAILGAMDGITSTASLVLGVAAAGGDRNAVLITGLAALVAGALSMAVGEYVSVSSQRDTELADIAKETWELENVPERELEELTRIYMHKGLDHDLAHRVAVALSREDPLKVHLAEELGITEETMARPVQAALTSAASFALGAAMPVALVTAAPVAARIVVTLVGSLLALGLLGTFGARVGGAEATRPTVRLVVLGAAAMAITTGVGHLLGTAIG